MTAKIKSISAKPLSVLTLLAALWASPLTASAAPAKLDASGLAVVDAVVQFCSGVDPASTPRYRQLARSLVGALSDRQRDAMQKTSDYRQTYSLFTGVLAGAPNDWAVTSCKNVIASTNGGDSDSRHDDHDKRNDNRRD